MVCTPIVPMPLHAPLMHAQVRVLFPISHRRGAGRQPLWPPRRQAVSTSHSQTAGCSSWHFSWPRLIWHLGHPQLSAPWLAPAADHPKHGTLAGLIWAPSPCGTSPRLAPWPADGHLSLGTLASGRHLCHGTLAKPCTAWLDPHPSEESMCRAHTQVESHHSWHLCQGMGTLALAP